MALDHAVDSASGPLLLCLLGDFRLLRNGSMLTLRTGGKTEALLGQLGIEHGHRMSRTALTELLWPASDAALANQSLNSLVYSLHKLVGDTLGGGAPVLHEHGFYRLNCEVGIGVDIARFDALSNAGDLHIRAGDRDAGAAAYRQAQRLYHGDLCVVTDVRAVVERERLRARHLTLLAWLADYHYRVGEFSACIEHAWRLLACDPSREDAHRLVMRCYVQHGERAAALHHYQVCATILRAEFDAAPEPATSTLFEQIRLHPDCL